MSGLGSETEVIEYRTGSDKTSTVRKLPGLTRYANIVLKRGVTQDAELWNWRKTVEAHLADRRNGSIVLLDDARNPILRWNFSNGWVSKIVGPELNAEANEVAIEQLIEIAHEGLTLDHYMDAAEPDDGVIVDVVLEDGVLYLEFVEPRVPAGAQGHVHVRAATRRRGRPGRPEAPPVPQDGVPRTGSDECARSSIRYRPTSGGRRRHASS